MATSPRSKQAGKSKEGARLYTLEVSLQQGPVTEEFAEKNPRVARTIEIRDDQTLEDLHYAIFEAYDREEEHLYEFQIGGAQMHDPKARRYVAPMCMEEPRGDPIEEQGIAGCATDTTIGSLGLKVEEAFGYWFDFGDDWMHQIDVVAISGTIPKGKYPRITHRVGESPPQYMDGDEEEDEEEEGDEPMDDDEDEDEEEA